VAFVAVTRLHLTSLWRFPAFFFAASASARQAQRAHGFICGALGRDAEWGLWTITVWSSDADMLAFRGAGAHRSAMPKLLRWCDEAAVAHWEQPAADIPSPQEAFERLSREGRPSKVAAPSARQQKGRTTGDARPAWDRRLDPRP
jgi:hypothetical protein